MPSSILDGSDHTPTSSPVPAGYLLLWSEKTLQITDTHDMRHRSSNRCGRANPPSAPTSAQGRNVFLEAK